MNPTHPTVFVLEDNVLYQQLIRRILLPVAVRSFFFSSGETLVSKLLYTKPDLAILDYNLEGAMTGLDALQAMRVQLPQLPVIMFSTCTDLATAENYQRFGHFEFVEKSASGISLLRDKVQHAFSQLN